MKERRKNHRMGKFLNRIDILTGRKNREEAKIKYKDGSGNIVTMEWTPLTLSDGTVLNTDSFKRCL